MFKVFLQMFTHVEFDACNTFQNSRQQHAVGGGRSGLQAGRSGTRTLLLRRHAVETRAECVSALSCWNKQGHPWRSRCLDGSICCSKTCMYLSACLVPSLMCKLPMMPRALTHPCTITHAGVWTVLMTVWMVLFLFGTTSRISKNSLTRGLVRPQDTFPLLASRAQVTRAREAGCDSGCC